MNNAKLFIVMYNDCGCSLGSFELEEVIKLLKEGNLEAGDKFVVCCEPGEDE